MTLLVVGAHAMDAEIMAGGLAAAQARQGRRVVLLHLTRGERGHPHKPPEIFAEQLVGEMAAAAAALGVEYRWSGLPAPWRAPEAAAPIIAATAREVQAQVLVTHWKGSWHPAHQAAHLATLAAAGSLHPPPPVLYAENCEDLEGFQPDWYADITPVFPSWLQALRCYELFRRSEPGAEPAAEIPYWAYYTAAARVRGLQAGLQWAEAFQSGPGAGGHQLGLVPAHSPRQR